MFDRSSRVIVLLILIFFVYTNCKAALYDEPVRDGDLVPDIALQLVDYGNNYYVFESNLSICSKCQPTLHYYSTSGVISYIGTNRKKIKITLSELDKANTPIHLSATLQDGNGYVARDSYTIQNQNNEQLSLSLEFASNYSSKIGENIFFNAPYTYSGKEVVNYDWEIKDSLGNLKFAKSGGFLTSVGYAFLLSGVYTVNVTASTPYSSVKKTATVNVTGDDASIGVLTVASHPHGRITSTPAGIDCVNCMNDASSKYSASFPRNQLVKLKIQADAGYYFSAMGCDRIVNANECEVTMSRNRYVGVVFNKADSTNERDFSALGAYIAESTYKRGDSVTIRANTYNFSNVNDSYNVYLLYFPDKYDGGGLNEKGKVILDVPLAYNVPSSSSERIESKVVLDSRFSKTGFLVACTLPYTRYNSNLYDKNISNDCSDPERIDLIDKPEFEFTNFGVKQDSKMYSEELSVSLSVRNKGAAIAGKVPVNIYVSPNQMMDASARFISSVTLPSLGIGQEFTLNDTPISLSHEILSSIGLSQEYWVFACASLDQLTCSSAQKKIIPAHLAISSFAVTNLNLVGSEFFITSSFDVENNIGTSSLIGKTVNFYLSEDAVLNFESDKKLSTSHSLNVPVPSKGKVSIKDVRLNLGSSSGYYYVFAHISDLTGDAVAYFPIEIGKPDLIMSELYFSEFTDNFYKSGKVEFSVVNDGSMDALSTDSTCTSFSDADASLNNLGVYGAYNIKFGVHEEKTFSFDVDKSWKSSRIVCEADVKKTVDEKDETNNKKEVAIILTEEMLPDMQIVRFQLPASIQPGVGFNVAVDIKNAGKASAGASTLTFYLISATGATSELNSISVPAVAAGQTLPLTPTVTIPNAGAYSFFVKIDNKEMVTESVESNNVTSESIVVQALADLHPVNLQIPASIKAGTSINVSVDIENLGGTATPASSLGVWLSEDDVLSGNEALPPVPIPAVLTSTSANVSFDVYIPEHITSNYRLFVKADAAQVVTESNEDNNQITANLVMEEITAKVYSVEPLVADVNENTVFTVKGIKLPNTLAFWIGYCEGLTKLPNATETQVQFSCTPSRAEKLQGLVKDKSGGSLLMEFFVEASVLDKDQDGIKDTLDNCPEIKNTDQKDLDRDKIGDVCDTDRDGDSVSNDQDAFPDDKAESKDNDKDGIGNNADSDDDNDGMPDTWEEQHGLDSLNPADATQDADKDSFTNKQEYDAGTDPKNAKSYPVTATISSVTPNTAIVGKRLELVITGKNLTGSIDVTLSGCDDMQIRTDGVYPQLSPKSALNNPEAPPSSPPPPPSSTLPPLLGVNDLVNQFIASCMPTVAGLKTGVIRDKAGSDYILKQFEVTVANVDTTPEPFPFTHQTGVALSALITSNEITVSGINTATAIAVTSGKYSINGDTYISTAGTVNNGDKVKVQHTSSASYSSKTDTTLAIGGVSSTFSSTTKANSPPTANSGSATTDEDNAVDIHLSGSDADGDTIAYIATQPANGMVSVLGDKATYTPKINWNGTDSFTFTVSDGRSSSAAATVTVKVNPVNDAPTASTVAATTNENKPVEITLIGTDVDGDIISYLVTQPANGTVSVLQNKAIYTPKANWSGTDSFTFMTSDGKLTSAATTVSLIVKAVNHAPTQQVSIRTCTRAAAGELVTCQVQYTTSDNEAKLGGLGLRIHHDSTKLTFVGVDNVLSKGLLSYDTEPFSDVENNDQDAHTDQHTRFAWVDMAAEWPNTTSLPTDLLTIRFRLNEDLKVGDTTTLRFTESETAEGYVFSSEPYVLAVANACTLDVDGNGQVRALTDGLLALRYMFNFKGVTLTNKVVAADATRKTALEIEPYLEQCKASFDIDGNSQIKALTDGLLILRYEFNFRGTKLTDKAVASDATRKTAEDIEPYLQRLYP